MAAALLSVAAPGADAGYLKSPLLLCDQGSFFVGGVPKITKFANSVTPAANYAQITVGQMYVQFQVPVLAKRWPLIIVHGSTHSGACVESTPQGSEGWAPYAVHNRLATYVVDQPGRARSGSDNARLHEAEATHLGLPGANATFPNLPTPTGPNLGRISDNGAYTNWFGHLVQPGTATTCTNILTCELMPHGWRADDPSPTNVHPSPAGYGPAFALNATSPFITPANLDKTGTGEWGPAPYGPAAAYKLHYYRQLLPNYEVTLPFSTCPTCTPTTLISANTAADYDSIPYLAIKGDYTVFNQGCQDVVDAINARRAAHQGTAKADYIQLDAASYKGKFNGVTHMMMDGTNNLQVMDEIFKWTDRYINNPTSSFQCQSPPPPAAG
jgi:hypothetical protein